MISQARLELDAEDYYLDQLNRAEIKQIAYWKPKRMGDIVFNFWD